MDSLAPPGAPHTWLPEEDWVGHHGIPVRRAGAQAGLGPHGARSRGLPLQRSPHPGRDRRTGGVDAVRLADELIAPWRAQADESRLGVLRDRTLRLLTQGHLAQHVFFHVFHNAGGSAAVATSLRISPAEFLAERARGRTVLEIAWQHGVSASALQTSLIDFFRAQQDEGIRRGVAFAPQSASHPRATDGRPPVLATQPSPGSRSRQSVRKGHAATRQARSRMARHRRPAPRQRPARNACGGRCGHRAGGGRHRGAGRPTDSTRLDAPGQSATHGGPVPRVLACPLARPRPERTARSLHASERGT